MTNQFWEKSSSNYYEFGKNNYLILIDLKISQKKKKKIKKEKI